MSFAEELLLCSPLAARAAAAATDGEVDCLSTSCGGFGDGVASLSVLLSPSESLDETEDDDEPDEDDIDDEEDDDNEDAVVQDLGFGI